MENNNKKDEWVDLPVENNSTQKDEWVDVPISDEGEKKNSISQPFYKQKPILEDIGGVSEIVSQLKSLSAFPSGKSLNCLLECISICFPLNISVVKL